MIATVSNDEVKIWHCNQDKVEACTSPQLPPDNKGKLLNLSWNHTNQVLAVSNSLGKIQLFHAQSGQNLSTIPFDNDNNNISNHHQIENPSHCISFSDNSRYIAQSIKSSVLVWDLKKRALKNDMFDTNNNNSNNQSNGYNTDVSALSFLSDGKLISGDVSGTIRIWDLKSNQLINRILSSMDPPSSSSTTITNTANISSSSSSSSAITCLKSANNKIASSYSNGTINIHDLNTTTLLRHQLLHTQSISCLNFSPKNSRLIATCSLDGKLILTDIHSKNGTEPTATIMTGCLLTGLSFHEDGVHTAVSTSTGKVMMFDWRNIKRPVLQFEAHSPHVIINAIAFQNPTSIASSSSSSSSVMSTNSSSINSNTASNTSATSGTSLSPRISQQPSSSSSSSATPVIIDKMITGVNTNNNSSLHNNSNVHNSSVHNNINSSAHNNSSVPRGDSNLITPQHQQPPSGADPLNTSYISVVSSVGEYTAAAEAGPTMTTTATTKMNISTTNKNSNNNINNSATATNNTNAAITNTPVKTSSTSAATTQQQQQPKSFVSANSGNSNSSGSINLQSSSSPRQTNTNHNNSSNNSNINTSNINTISSSSSSTPISSRSINGNATDDQYYVQQQLLKSAPPSSSSSSSSSSSIVSHSPIANANNNNNSNNSAINYNNINNNATNTNATNNNLKRINQSPVTHQQLQEALVSLRYDVHKDVQAVLREQNRLFSLAKDDTAELFDTMKDMLQQLLEANRELRIENERLRHIY